MRDSHTYRTVSYRSVANVVRRRPLGNDLPPTILAKDRQFAGGRNPRPGTSPGRIVRRGWGTFDDVNARRVIVVGGGVCGLVAAHSLQKSGCQVTLVEASDGLGGQVRSAQLDGQAVDLGAEAAPLRAPGVQKLITELGLDASMIHPAQGTSLLSSRHGVVPLPDGVTPVGPTKLFPTIASRVLSPADLLRAGLEPVLARPQPAGVTVGEFIGARFGKGVATAIVDPLVGAIHAADINAFALESVSPGLVRTATSGDSILQETVRRELGLGENGSRLGRHAKHPTKAPRTPTMGSWRQGMGELTTALSANVTVLTGTRAVALTRGKAFQDATAQNVTRSGVGTGDVNRAEGRAASTDDQEQQGPSGRWLLEVADESGRHTLAADSVVLATPTAVSAELLRSVAPDTASTLSKERAVTVAAVVLRIDRPTHPLAEAVDWFVGSAWSPLIRQVVNLTNKWPDRHPADTHLLRLNVGRDRGINIDQWSDEELGAASVEELGRIGLRVNPHNHLVHRFTAAMPQPGPLHHERIDAVRTGLSRLPGLFAAGAGVNGAGVPNAIIAGNKVATDVLEEKLLPQNP